MNYVQVARIAHDAIYTLNHFVEERTEYPRWFDRTPEDRQMYVDAAKRVAFHPDVTQKTMHDLWMASKLAEGWVYGPERDYVKKTHPSLVPNEELSELEKAKDQLFINVVRALEPLLIP